MFQLPHPGANDLAWPHNCLVSSLMTPGWKALCPSAGPFQSSLASQQDLDKIQGLAGLGSSRGILDIPGLATKVWTRGHHGHQDHTVMTGAELGPGGVKGGRHNQDT